MIKKIVIISLLYTALVFAITLNMDKIGDLSIFILLILSVAFFAFTFREVYRKYIVGFKPDNNEVNYGNSTVYDFDTLKKISMRPFLFGLEKKLISDDEFYFDDDRFYAINKNLNKAVFKLTDITELSTTPVKINKRRLWQIKVKQGNDKEITFKFAPNYTLWNKNFKLFYDKVQAANPNAIQSKWSLWT